MAILTSERYLWHHHPSHLFKSLSISKKMPGGCGLKSHNKLLFFQQSWFRGKWTPWRQATHLPGPHFPLPWLWEEGYRWNMRSLPADLCLRCPHLGQCDRLLVSVLGKDCKRKLIPLGTHVSLVKNLHFSWFWGPRVLINIEPENHPFLEKVNHLNQTSITFGVSAIGFFQTLWLRHAPSRRLRVRFVLSGLQSSSIRSHALEQAGFGAKQHSDTEIFFVSAYSELDRDIT